VSSSNATGHDQGDSGDDPWNETADARRVRLTALLKATCQALRQDFDSVQIVCTSHADIGDDGETTVCCWGSGNWYARLASVEELMESMKGMFNGGGRSAEGDGS
jgi:hypothetical protein